jgi:hypothetical protein
MYQPPALPPPGWYPDPERVGSLRWWTGSEWALSSASFTAPTDQLPETGSMLSGAFRRVLRHWRALSVLALLGGVLPGVLSLIALDQLSEGVRLVDDDVIGWTDSRVPGVIALFVASLVAGWLGHLAITSLMLRAYDEEVDHDAANPARPTARSTGDEVRAAGQAIAGAAAALPRAIGWGLLGALGAVTIIVTVVVMTVFVLPIGIMLIIGLLPFGVWIGAKLAFAIQAVVDASGNPYARSWVVSQERFWPVLGRVLLLAVVAGAINYGSGLVGTIASGGNALGSGTTFEIESDATAASTDVDFDDIVDVDAVTIVVTAITSIVTTVFATSMVLAGCSELYRTRNRRST